MEINKIHHKDCIQGMREMKKESVDMVLTSPPYPGASMWSLPEEAIKSNIKRLNDLSMSALKESIRILKDGGVIAWNVANIPWGGHGTITFASSLMIEGARTMGLSLRGDIIWDKGVTHMAPPCFMRRPAIPNLTHEYLLIFFKGDWNPREKEITLSKKEKAWLARSIWCISPESASALGHVSPFPIELARRCISLWSLKGDLILDPFMGSGTTAVVCRQLERNYVGFENNKTYISLAESRLQQTVMYDWINTNNPPLNKNGSM